MLLDKSNCYGSIPWIQKFSGATVFEKYLTIFYSKINSEKRKFDMQRVINLIVIII
jgi:hypothetical protein